MKILLSLINYSRLKKTFFCENSLIDLQTSDLNKLTQNETLKIIEPPLKNLEVKNVTLTSDSSSKWTFGFIVKDTQMYTHHFFHKGVVLTIFVIVFITTLFCCIHCIKTKAFHNWTCYKILVCLSKTEFH